MVDWVDRLLATLEVAPQTIMQYSICLRYWDAWHRLRYGTPLPLAETPSRSVDANILKAFINDHLAIAVGGRLQMRMAPAIFHGLRAAGYNARGDCVAPTTVDWRLQVLRKAHRVLNLQLDQKLIRVKKPEIYSVWEAERAALSIPVTLPMSATNTLIALLSACNDDRDGIMDAALVLFVCRLTPNQVARLRFTELTPGTVLMDGQKLDAVECVVHDPIGELQKFQPKIRFLGEEAAMIKAWGALREDEIQGDDWFFARKMRRNTSPALNHGWIARRIKMLAQHAGLADASGRTQCSPRWLRKAYEREWMEHSDLVQISRAAGVHTDAIMHMTRRARLSADDSD